MAISATLGGSILFDGRDIWEIAFDVSTGNVPTLNALGSNGVTGGTSGATGELFRVWAAGEYDPRASGGAMPTSGYIKLRTKTGTFVDNEVITLPGGATVTVNSATGGRRSWVQIVGERAQTITVPRLGKLEAYGDWYYLSDTDGTDNQVITTPFLAQLPAVQVETASGSGVYEWWLNAGDRWQDSHSNALSFISTDARGKFFGQQIRLLNCSVTSGSNIITCSDTTGIVVGAGVTASGQFASTDRLYVTAVTSGTTFTVQSNANANASTVAVRICAPRVQLAHRGTYSCGLKPPTGCKVRVPNLLIATTESPFGGITQEAASTNSWDLTTTSAGVVILDKVNDEAYLGVTGSAYQVSYTFVSSFKLQHSNTATAAVVNDCAVGIQRAVAVEPVTISNQFTGVDLQRITCARYSDASNSYSFNVLDAFNVVLSGILVYVFGSTTTVEHTSTTQSSISLQRISGLTMSDCTVVGGRIYIIQTTNATIGDTVLCDRPQGTTTTTSPRNAFDIQAMSSDILIDGVSLFPGIANIHPYQPIVTLAGSVSNIEVRNIGTPAAPFECGSANQCAGVGNVSVCKDITFRRCYLQNTRVEPITTANTCQGLTLINLWGDAADTRAMVALECVVQGGRWTNGTTGQSSVYGTHWMDLFTSTTAGRFVISCNEPLPDTVGQCTFTLGTNAGFTSSGLVAMPNLGDTVTWEMPYFALGHTSMANNAPTLSGTNTANFTYEFQYDTGAGFNGTWLTLNGTNLSGIGAIDPNTGIRFKVRATTAIASSTNALSYIRFDSVTNATDQQIQYPLSVVLPTLTLAGTTSLSGAEIRIYDLDNTPVGSLGTELAGTESNVGATFEYSYEYVDPGNTVWIQIMKDGYVEYGQEYVTTANDTTLTVILQVDNNA